MCSIELGEYIATRIGPSGKLNKERWEKVAALLFIEVPEVKIKVGQQGLVGIAQRYDVLYDRRTVNNGVSWTNVGKLMKDTPEDTLP